MASKKAASRKAVDNESVGKKMLHMADRCRSRCRSRNGAAPQSHTSLSEELSAMAHEEQLRRASWYWGTVHCLNELEQEGLLGIGTAPGVLKWPGDDCCMSGLQGAAKAYIAATEIRGLWVTHNSILQLQKQIHQQLKQYSSSRQTAVFCIRIALVAILYTRHSTLLPLFLQV